MKLQDVIAHLDTIVCAAPFSMADAREMYDLIHGMLKGQPSRVEVVLSDSTLAPAEKRYQQVRVTIELPDGSRAEKVYAIT